MATMISESTRSRVSTLSQAGPVHSPAVNVGQFERWLSLVGGAGLALYGASRGTSGGLALAALGGGLIARGLVGYAPLYDALDVRTSGEPRGPATSIPADQGVKVRESVTVNRSPEELFRFWRNFENLPSVMRHLESVTMVDNRRSHWVAKGPLGMTFSWDAEIHTERANELIGWRSLDGSQVATAGSVHFVPAPGNRGTEVHVVLKYEPPAGKVGALAAWLFGKAPGQEIREDLRRFKAIMEAGEFLTTKGQPRGTCSR